MKRTNFFFHHAERFIVSPLVIFLASVVLCAGLYAASSGWCGQIHKKEHTVPRDTLREFTFLTTPDGALVEISFDGMKRENIGFSGKKTKIDLSRLSGQRTVKVYFTLKGYIPTSRDVEAIFFFNHNRYPVHGSSPVRLESALRAVTFLTYPRGAEIYRDVFSNPQAPEYLGRSGVPLTWDLSKFGPQSKCRLLLKLPLYHDESIEVGNYAFYPNKSHTYPLDGKPIPLRPRIIFVASFFHLIKNNTLVAGVIFVAVSALLSFLIYSFILPKHRAQRELLKRTAQWEVVAALADQSEPMFGKRIGIYKIVEKLGAGGMAAVYRALPEATCDEKESVAIKIMKADLAKNDEDRRRFKREVKISSTLNHPSVMRVLEFGEQEGMLYLVMELVRGKMITDLIPQSGMSLKMFYHYFKPVFEGVHYAHEQGIIHRDLKSDNVMVTDDDKVRVMDFGLARGDRYSVVTMDGDALGTPSYMAPEQITDNATIDSRMDQYSLGIMAFQTLTGHLPFQDDKPVNVLLKHLQEPPPHLRQFRPDLPARLETMLLRMMEKEPERRFASLKDVIYELEEIIREHKIQRGT